jgi:hypothetical protein
MPVIYLLLYIYPESCTINVYAINILFYIRCCLFKEQKKAPMNQWITKLFSVIYKFRKKYFDERLNTHQLEKKLPQEISEKNSVHFQAEFKRNLSESN